MVTGFFTRIRNLPVIYVTVLGRLCPNESVGNGDSGDSILGVTVSADLVGPGLRDRRAADHHLDLAHRPASTSASVILLCSDIVIVSSAEAPINVAFDSLTATTNSDAGLSMPTSVAWKPVAKLEKSIFPGETGQPTGVLVSGLSVGKWG